MVGSPSTIKPFHESTWSSVSVLLLENNGVFGGTTGLCPSPQMDLQRYALLGGFFILNSANSLGSRGG